MGILLWVVGALALGSGAIKLRAATQTLVGRSPLTLAEILMGAVVAFGAGAGLARVRPLAWLAVAATLGLVAAATVAHGRRIARSGKERERSTERRLRRYLGLPDR